MLTLPIETERLRIHLFTPEDWQAVHAYTSNAEVKTYIPEGQMTAEQTRQCIERDENTWWDEYFYALLEDEWFQANNPG